MAQPQPATSKVKAPEQQTLKGGRVEPAPAKEAVTMSTDVQSAYPTGNGAAKSAEEPKTLEAEAFKAELNATFGKEAPAADKKKARDIPMPVATRKYTAEEKTKLVAKALEYEAQLDDLRGKIEKLREELSAKEDARCADIKELYVATGKSEFRTKQGDTLKIMRKLYKDEEGYVDETRAERWYLQVRKLDVIG